MKNILLITILGIFMQSCTPKVSTNLTNANFAPIEAINEIIVVGIEGRIPDNSKFVGNLKIGDSGFSTDCGYEKVIEEAKNTARQSGANLILLTEVKKPNLGSTCYRIKASMYRNLDEEALASLNEKRNLINKSRLPEDADHAVIHFYRPSNFSGSAIGYKIRLEDGTIIGRVRNGEKFEYTTKEFGEMKFWGKTESEDFVVIDIKKGEEYFVRCGIKMGVAVGRPEIYLMENHIGIKEIEEMK